MDQGHSDSYCSMSLPGETALHRAVVSGEKAPDWVLRDKLVQGEGAGLRAIGQVRAGKPQQQAGSFSRSCSRTWVWISWEQSLRQIQNSLERIHLIWSRMASGLPWKRWRGVWGGGLEYLPSALKPQPQIGKKGWTRGLQLLEQQRCCSSCSSYSCSANRPLLWDLKPKIPTDPTNTHPQLREHTLARAVCKQSDYTQPWRRVRTQTRSEARADGNSKASAWEQKHGKRAYINITCACIMHTHAHIAAQTHSPFTSLAEVRARIISPPHSLSPVPKSVAYDLLWDR